MQVIHCGTINEQKLYSKTWAIMFKGVYYAFMKEGTNQMRITKISKAEGRILETYSVHIQDARILWKQLRYRKTAKLIQYNYYHD